MMVDSIDRKLILIVDDTPTNISIVSGLLKDRYRLKAANRGETALAMIHTGDLPDLILLDIMMPGLDGYEVCRQLKSDQRTRDIPIIFLTAKDQIEDEAFGLMIGAVDYIVKPIKPSILFARIQTHLALSDANKRLAIQNHILIETARLREDVEHIIRHDLKTQLNIILSIPQLLLMESELNDKQRKFINIIDGSGHQMMKMVNRSLDLYKMESDLYYFRPESINIIDIINDVIKNLDIIINLKSIKIIISINNQAIEFDQVVMAEVEPMLCHSMLSDLIKNAIEASEIDGIVNIKIHKGINIIISIENNGEVPEQIRDNFFDKFVTFGKPGGTGLGTYSASLIARTLNASLSLDTSIKGKTVLHITLKTAGGGVNHTIEP